MLTKSLINTALILLILFSLSDATGQNNISKKDKKTISSLDKYFEQALQDWEVPGMAIGIVKNGETILCKGYGLREIGTNKKIDKSTLFPIASNTKAFTSTLLAMLVDEGKITWEDKVREYLPYFKLYDPYVSENMTITDLLCHRSGLNTFSGDLLWYGSNYSREEVVRKARFLKPEYGFRTEYGYQNLMFIAAGEIIPKITTYSYDEYLDNKIFTPLGMNTTNTSITDMVKFENHAIAHSTKNENVVPIEFVNWDNIGGAGVINSSAEEMTHWIKFLLNSGIYNEDTLINANILHETWEPKTIQSVSSWWKELFPSTHFKAYAMGWGVQDMFGKKVISHGGGYDGIVSFTAFVPEEDFGFVVLTNKKLVSLLCNAIENS